MFIYFYRFLDQLKSSPARKNGLFITATSFSLVMNLATFALIYFKFRPLVQNLPLERSFIPLHYNIYLGIDWYGHWQQIFILPVMALIIFVINTVLGLIFYNKKVFASYFLALTNAVQQIFFFIATALAILINI